MSALPASRRFMVGLEGCELTARERRQLTDLPPYGVILFSWNMRSAEQTAALIEEVRALASPVPLLFVDQEGGPVDRIGPLMGLRFPSASKTGEKGSDRVHENANLMGRAARLLGFDVDLAPVLDLAQPGTGAVVLAGRTYGFHAEDVSVSALVFLHGLKRAGMASCLKHFPGLGRGALDTHLALPVVDAHDVDMMVTDVAPFKALARSADGVMVGHAAYPGFTGDHTPASLSPVIHRILRGPVGFDGVVYSDDLVMGALEGTLAERVVRASEAGCDVLCVRNAGDAYEELVARLAELGPGDAVRAARLEELRRRCDTAPREPFSLDRWERLAGEVQQFLVDLEKPRERRPEPEIETT